MLWIDELLVKRMRQVAAGEKAFVTNPPSILECADWLRAWRGVVVDAAAEGKRERLVQLCYESSVRVWFVDMNVWTFDRVWASVQTWSADRVHPPLFDDLSIAQGGVGVKENLDVGL